jgi:hypothetical protein
MLSPTWSRDFSRAERDLNLRRFLQEVTEEAEIDPKLIQKPIIQEFLLGFLATELSPGTGLVLCDLCYLL